jgi:hypothetical protein
LSKDSSGDVDAWSNVIEDVDHPEPAVAIDPEESARTAHELWASGIERIGSTGSWLSRRFVRSRRRIWLLTFSRHNDELDKVILSSSPATDLIRNGKIVQPPWANGAKVLVGDVDPDVVDVDLCPRHVLVHEEDRDFLLVLLASLPYKVRPRLKPGCGLARVPSETSLLQDLSVTSAAEYSSTLSTSPAGAFTEQQTLFFEMQLVRVRNTFIDIVDLPNVCLRRQQTV